MHCDRSEESLNLTLTKQRYPVQILSVTVL